MNTRSVTGSKWSTASYGAGVDTPARELNALGEHLHLCCSIRGRMFELRCKAEEVHDFLAARFVSTLVACTLLVGTGVLVL